MMLLVLLLQLLAFLAIVAELARILATRTVFKAKTTEVFIVDTCVSVCVWVPNLKIQIQTKHTQTQLHTDT